MSIEFHCNEGFLHAVTRIYLCSDIFLAKYLVVKCCLDNMHYNGLRNTKRVTGKNTVILKYIFLIFYCWLDKYKTSKSLSLADIDDVHNSFKVFICTIIHFLRFIMNISNSMQFTYVLKKKQKKIIMFENVICTYISLILFFDSWLICYHI